MHLWCWSWTLSPMCLSSGLSRLWFWTHSLLRIGVYAINHRTTNIVDSDETARYEPSHMDLHGLQNYLFWSAKLKGLNGIEALQRGSNLSWKAESFISLFEGRPLHQKKKLLPLFMNFFSVGLFLSKECVLREATSFLQGYVTLRLKANIFKTEWSLLEAYPFTINVLFL